MDKENSWGDLDAIYVHVGQDVGPLGFMVEGEKGYNQGLYLLDTRERPWNSREIFLQEGG